MYMLSLVTREVLQTTQITASRAWGRSNVSVERVECKCELLAAVAGLIAPLCPFRPCTGMCWFRALICTVLECLVRVKLHGGCRVSGYSPSFCSLRLRVSELEYDIFILNRYFSVGELDAAVVADAWISVCCLQGQHTHSLIVFGLFVSVKPSNRLHCV